MKHYPWKHYPCLVCNKPIDDDGHNFCSKCRAKDWKIRFIAIRNAEKTRNLSGRYRNFNPILNDVAGSYFAKRRN